MSEAQEDGGAVAAAEELPTRDLDSPSLHSFLTWEVRGSAGDAEDGSDDSDDGSGPSLSSSARKSMGMLRGFPQAANWSFKDRSCNTVFTERNKRFKIVVYSQQSARCDWRVAADSDLQGWALRRSRWSGGWKSRFFTLQGHRLFYAENEGHPPHGFVDLRRCTRILTSVEMPKPELVIFHRVGQEDSPLAKLAGRFGADRIGTPGRGGPNPIDAQTRAFRMKFESTEALEEWKTSLAQACSSEDGLDGEKQLPHDGPAFLNGEVVLREGYVRRAKTSAGKATWSVRYLYLTPSRLVWVADWGSERRKKTLPLSVSTPVRIMVPAQDAQTPQEYEENGENIVNVTVKVPKGAGPHKQVKGSFMTTSGPHEVLVDVPPGAEPGSTVTVKVCVRYAKTLNEDGELERDRQVTVCAGDNFVVLQFLSVRETLAWATDIQSVASRLEQDRLSRHIRQSREHFTGVPLGEEGRRLSGSLGLLQRSRSLAHRKSTGQISSRSSEPTFGDEAADASH